MKQINVKLNMCRSTKGTHVFENTEPDTAIPTLYIRKSAFQGEPPASITVTVTDVAKTQDRPVPLETIRQLKSK